MVTVEVTEGADALAQSLTARGWQVAVGSRHSSLDVRHDDDSVLDAIRDTAADLGLGLLRLEPRRHALAEIFADPALDVGGGPDVA